ncbi:hypothetical protein QM012_002025 [Aureobasidium pullulans]|uniref:Uncharacterized protein n=1 Tax=Aureobasidium pullulans TaxID=5580 RepID=A0ABR0TD66_AURPU
MSLLEDDKDFIQAMFRDNCTAATVLKKRRGRRKKIDGPMHEYLIELLSLRNDTWLEELVFELWCQFGVKVHKSTISRLLKSNALSNKVNTRIVKNRDAVQQGIYEERLAELIGEGVVAGVVEDPVDMLLYLDELAASEKVLFRRRS